MQFTKIDRGILHSSLAADYEARHMFQDMTLLCDWEGNVDMTYEAIASVLRVPFEKVVVNIRKLCEPDPESRSKKCEGRRLIPLDSERSWGWKIVNWAHYRDKRDPQERRQKQRDLMRQKRKRERDQKKADVNKTLTSVNTREQTGDPVNSCEHALTKEGDLPRQPVSSALTTVSTREQTLAHIDIDKDKSSPCRPPKGGPQTPNFANLLCEELVSDPEEFKRLICELILHKDPKRPWGYDAMEKMGQWLPVPRFEIERIGWFRNLPDDGSPQLARRQFITEVGLMNFWGDEFSRANAFWQETYGWRLEKNTTEAEQ